MDSQFKISKDLDSWEEFAPAIDQLRAHYGSPDKANGVLFRGMRDASWELLTTLERRTTDSFDVVKYVNLADRAADQLRSQTGQRWVTMDRPELEEWPQNHSHAGLPCYDYCVYLRHHGFPSPLLDWTESPFLAAFFAFSDSATITRGDRVAVYMYVDARVHSCSVGEPVISLQGPFVTTHARHFQQQAWYSLATRWDSAAGTHEFCRHSLVFNRQEQPVQDVLVRITLPRSERLAALRFLREANITYFTLFGTEDSLVRTMDMDLFDLGR